jgi:hypothetical protein
MKKLVIVPVVLAALLAVVLAVGVYFWFDFQQAKADQLDITGGIAEAQAKLEDVRNEEQEDPAPYLQRLADLQAEIEALETHLAESPQFPAAPPTIEIGDLVVAATTDLELGLLKLKSNEGAGTVTIDSDTDPKTKGNKYAKAEYEVEVKGELGRIIGMLGRMEGAGFATLILEDIQIKFVPEETEDGEVVNPSYWVGEFTIVTLYQYAGK